MTLWVTIKNLFLKQVVKIAPKLAKGFLNSVLGKNKGEVVVYREEINQNVICFVHGFSGSAADTFGRFPQLIIEDKELDGWDIVSVGYASDVMPTLSLGLWAAQPNITRVADFMHSNLLNLLGRYPRIALVSHSMGGLVIQRAILDLDKVNQKRISHVLLYGTPSGGLFKASLGKWYNIQIRDMAKGGSYITKLRADWSSTFNTTLPFFFAVIAGQLDEFVPVESCLEPFDRRYHEHTTGNHIDMVKPDTKHHSSYQILKKALVEKVKPYLQLYSHQELNNMRGSAELIIQSFKASTQLDTRSFREYIFALDAAGALEESIEVLQTHELVKSNTDFMGILGGRYKRRYMMTDEVTSKNKAIALYEKAFETAKQKSDHPQIFYHTINLAFMHLYGNNDHQKMEEYAKISMENAKTSRSEKWRNATLGEASLYLSFINNGENIEDAINHYKTAIGQTTDLRERSSMFFNAFNACTALGRDDWARQIEDCFKLGSAQ
jgi:hypothetical protein